LNPKYLRNAHPSAKQVICYNLVLKKWARGGLEKEDTWKRRRRRRRRRRRSIQVHWKKMHMTKLAKRRRSVDLGKLLALRSV